MRVPPNLTTDDYADARAALFELGRKLRRRRAVAPDIFVEVVRSYFLQPRGSNKIPNHTVNNVNTLIKEKLFSPTTSFSTAHAVESLIDDYNPRMSDNAYATLNMTLAKMWAGRIVGHHKGSDADRSTTQFRLRVGKFDHTRRSSVQELLTHVENLRKDSILKNGRSYEAKLLQPLIEICQSRLTSIDAEISIADQNRTELLSRKIEYLKFEFGGPTPKRVLEHYEEDQSNIDVHPAFCALSEIAQEGPMIRPIMAYLATDIRDPGYLTNLLQELRLHEDNPRNTSYTPNEIKHMAKKIVSGLLWNPNITHDGSSVLKDICTSRDASIGVAMILTDLGILDPEKVWQNFVDANTNVPKIVDAETLIIQLTKQEPLIAQTANVANIDNVATVND